MLVLLKRIALLPSIHPDGDSGDQNRQWQQYYRYVRSHAALSFSHRQPPVGRILRADRNKILVLGEPRYGVHEEIAVALRAGKSIGCKVRVTINDQPRLLVFSKILCRNNRQWYRTLQISLFVEARFGGFHVGFTPASLVRGQKLFHRESRGRHRRGRHRTDEREQ